MSDPKDKLSASSLATLAQGCAVFGAYVAAQAMEKRRMGRGAPTAADVAAYVEEADALAEMVMEHLEDQAEHEEPEESS